MGNWILLADIVGLATLIKIGLVLLFVVGPYLLKLIGGRAVQDDRGNARPARRREPQSELEKEIAEFLQQSRGGSPTPAPTESYRNETVEAESRETRESSDFVEAVTPHETLRDHHLTSNLREDQLQPASTPDRTGESTSQSAEAYTYEEAEVFSYDTDYRTAGAGAGAEIAAMFRDPGKIRNAFILGEIMNRPKFPPRR